jgi:hypothetical protein
VTVEVGEELGRRLGVPTALVEYRRAAEVVDGNSSLDPPAALRRKRNWHGRSASRPCGSLKRLNATPETDHSFSLRG